MELAELERGEFPPKLERQRPPGFCAIYSKSVLDAIATHAAQNVKVEICGVLVGRPLSDHHGSWVEITASIPGNAADSQAASVTFTADTWAQIQDTMERDHPDLRIVGWYHTHPNFDIFLSEMDVFICSNFFNLPWQIAYVLDPVRHVDGSFVWVGETPTREPHIIDYDVIAPPTDWRRKLVRPEGTIKRSGPIVQLMSSARELDRVGILALSVLAFLTTFLLVYAVIMTLPREATFDLPITPSTRTTP